VSCNTFWDNTWHLRDNTWHLRDNTWHLRDNTWHLRDNTWHLRFEMMPKNCWMKIRFCFLSRSVQSHPNATKWRPVELRQQKIFRHSVLNAPQLGSSNFLPIPISPRECCPWCSNAMRLPAEGSQQPQMPQFLNSTKWA
jgi:hypothetical protein